MPNTLLKGDTIQLMPFTPNYWQLLAQWFYDEDHKDMFRQYNRMYTEEDFKQYNRVIDGEVFMIHDIKTEKCIGFCQVVPDSKKNKAGFIGMLINKENQKKHIPHEALLIFLNYLFNRQGYNKVIVEILESNTSTRKSLEKTGFYKEGKLLQECFMDGKYQNELRFSMSAFYFNKNKQRSQREYKSWVDSSKALPQQD